VFIVCCHGASHSLQQVLFGYPLQNFSSILLFVKKQESLAKKRKTKKKENETRTAANI